MAIEGWLGLDGTCSLCGGQPSLVVVGQREFGALEGLGIILCALALLWMLRR